MVETGIVVETNIASFKVETPNKTRLFVLQYHAKTIRFDKTGHPVWTDLPPGKREEVPVIGTRVVLSYDPFSNRAYAWMDAARYELELADRPRL